MEKGWLAICLANQTLQTKNLVIYTSLKLTANAPENRPSLLRVPVGQYCDTVSSTFVHSDYVIAVFWETMCQSTLHWPLKFFWMENISTASEFQWWGPLGVFLQGIGFLHGFLRRFTLILPLALSGQLDFKSHGNIGKAANKKPAHRLGETSSFHRLTWTWPDPGTKKTALLSIESLLV